MTSGVQDPVRVQDCPKRMVFGPCGGVRQDGGCEMRAGPCVFESIRSWPAQVPVAESAVVDAPLVLADLSAPPADRATLEAVAAVLAPHCDAVLMGDHQDRPDYPPTTLARLLSEVGARPWVTLACRDRNRYGLEQELHGLALDGLATVLCVTGDGRAFDVRPDITQVFDLDGTRLAALAASFGLPVAVVETPTAPPTELRPARLVQKQRAGAGVAVLNHVRSVVEVAAFVDRGRQLGLTVPVVASVAVYTDTRSAAVLAALPGLELDQAAVGRVLSAPDPVAAGIARAVAEARAMLGVEGVAGVNLSGMASARGPMFAAEVQAEIGQAIRLGDGAMNEAMDAEFDTVAVWTAEVAVEMGQQYYLPAACRGSGSPAAMRWLLDRLGVGEQDRMLDCGGGVGGPAAFAARETGARVILSDPEAGACRSAARLFRLACVQAGSELPLATESFDGVWSLGVLCTVADQQSLLDEMRRVLKPRGRLGLLVYVAQHPPLSQDLPGNNFPTPNQLTLMLHHTGFQVQDRTTLAQLDPPPARWTERAQAVENALSERHSGDPRWEQAAAQSRKVGELLRRNEIVGTLLVAAPPVAGSCSP